MQIVPAADIIIHPRQRKTMDDGKFDQLKLSLHKHGLMHPIVVEKCLDETKRTKFKLIAGGRRMGAIAQLQTEGITVLCESNIIPVGHFPVTLAAHDLDEITAREMELDENLVREDLTWQDIVTAKKELHDLRQLQNPKQTLKETAEEIVSKTGGTRSVTAVAQEVSRATIIGEHMDDPVVAKAKSEGNAWKAVSRKLEREFEAMLPKVETPHTIIVGDATTQFALLKDNTFQCIIADPPYGINADKFGDAAALEHTYADKNSLDFYDYIIGWSHKLTTDEAMLYLFCDIEYFLDIRMLAKSYGWSPRRTPLLWLKGSAGHLDSGYATGWRRTYELIFVAWKPNVKMKELVNDTFNIGIERDKSHAAQKPKDLYKQLLKQCCVRGQQVLDPCCGSGTIFAAANDLELVATGIELDPDMAKIAESRMHKQSGQEQVNDISEQREDSRTDAAVAAALSEF